MPLWHRKIYEKVFRKESDPAELFAPDAGRTLRNMCVAEHLFRAVAVRKPSGLILPAAVLSYEF